MKNAVDPNRKIARIKNISNERFHQQDLDSRVKTNY
jgi:hypothetical protein